MRYGHYVSLLPPTELNWHEKQFPFARQGFNISYIQGLREVQKEYLRNIGMKSLNTGSGWGGLAIVIMAAERKFTFGVPRAVADIGPPRGLFLVVLACTVASLGILQSTHRVASSLGIPCSGSW